ncbi:hypothetical protein [Macrococcoides canis]|uniref:hypothetical protein n=1 Tax=Macrococcoides canis TaxID=1855823 RepID=UPI0022B89E56|nr:hypothetical protein [Macrococcus canis]WBF54008.1 hypothetical protein LL975_11940 [Macrococcus canis]
MNNKLSGIIIIGLSIVLCIGYFISHSKINNVEKENEILQNKIKNFETLNKKSEKNFSATKEKNTIEEPTTVDKNDTQEYLVSFTEDFIKTLNDSSDIEKTNERLKSYTTGQAQDYLIENHYIHDISKLSTEGTDQQKNKDVTEGYIQKEVSIDTENIRTYIKENGENQAEGITTYQTISHIGEDSTVGNFLMKATYIKQNNEWTIEKIVSISPVSDIKAEQIFN